MKIIPQSATYLDTTGMTQYQIIERVGRTCYKSEDKITEDSARDFVSKLVKSGHMAMVEFGYVYLKITDEDFLEFFTDYKPHFIHMINNGASIRTYAVGNFRAYYDWYKEYLDGKWMIPMCYFDAFMDLIWALSRQWPEVFKDLYDQLHKKFEPLVDDSDDMTPHDIKYPFQLITKEELIEDWKNTGNHQSPIPNPLCFIIRMNLIK